MLLTGFPSAVGAHAFLERSTPLQNEELKQSPTEIRLQFSEKIDPKLSQITLLDGKGNPIEGQLSSDGEKTLVYKVPELKSGVYKVEWKVLSADTHVVDGSFRFSVAVPLENEKPSETISLDDPGPSPEHVPDTPKPVNGTESEAGPGPKPDASPGTGTHRETQSIPASSNSAPTSEGQSAASGGNKPASDPAHVHSPQAGADGSAGKDIAPATGLPGGQSPDAGHSHEHAQPDRTDSTKGQSEAQTGNGAADKGSQKESVSAHHDHAHHGHGHGEGDWRTFVQHSSRVVDVLLTVGIAGFLFFRYVVWGFTRENAPALFSKKSERRMLAVALIGFAATGVLHVWMLAEQLGTGTDSVLTIAASTMVGGASWLRPLLTVLLFALTYAPERDEKWAAVLKGLAAFGLIALFPLTGHAYGSSSGVWYAVSTHTLHMAAAAVWFGGLFGILLLTRLTDDPVGTVGLLNGVIRKFSNIALPVIAAVAVTGIALALLRLKSWGALFQSDYDRLVLAKTVILLVVIAIGAFHRLRFVPRMTAAARGSANPDTKAANRFAAGVRLEVALALAAFILAGTLSTTAPPATGPVSEPIYWHVMGEKAHLSFRIEERESGGQLFRLDVWLPTGAGAPKSVNVQAVKEDDGGSPVAIPFEYKTGGPDPYGFEGFDKYTYEAVGDYLTEPGQWKMTIDIAVSTGEVHHYEKSVSFPAGEPVP